LSEDRIVARVKGGNAGIIEKPVGSGIRRCDDLRAFVNKFWVEEILVRLMSRG
jgi:hypothetical protein